MRKGFTLIELVIVIAIIGIMSAILIPTFTNLMEQNKQKIINIYNEPKKVYMLNGKEITEEESKQYTLVNVEYKGDVVVMFFEGEKNDKENE